jgi:hypothetical protein
VCDYSVALKTLPRRFVQNVKWFQHFFPTLEFS